MAILAYELVAGNTPFSEYPRDDESIMENILKVNYILFYNRINLIYLNHSLLHLKILLKEDCSKDLKIELLLIKCYNINGLWRIIKEMIKNIYFDNYFLYF